MECIGLACIISVIILTFFAIASIIISYNRRKKNENNKFNLFQAEKKIIHTIMNDEKEIEGIIKFLHDAEFVVKYQLEKKYNNIDNSLDW